MTYRGGPRTRTATIKLCLPTSHYEYIVYTCTPNRKLGSTSKRSLTYHLSTAQVRQCGERAQLCIRTFTTSALIFSIQINRLGPFIRAFFSRIWLHAIRGLRTFTISRCLGTFIFGRNIFHHQFVGGFRCVHRAQTTQNSCTRARARPFATINRRNVGSHYYAITGYGQRGGASALFVLLRIYFYDPR